MTAPTPSTPRRSLPGRRRVWRLWLLAGALVAVVALVAAAVVLVPWWNDGHLPPQHLRLAAGRAHTCAVADDGRVTCWGDNSFGQLGDGTQTSSNRPVQVQGLPGPVVALSGTGNHTCALTDAGAVLCWGDNAFGQLGDGGTQASGRPVRAQGLDAGVLALSAGPGHTCALTRERAVQCWGANGLSQLGTGDSVDRSAPAPVADLPARVTGLSVGNGYTCVVFTGRTIRCWGDNSDGQLGVGDTTPRASWAPLESLPRTSSVSAGDTSACSVTRDGGVWCWGDNWAGQLGDGGALANSPLPVGVPDVSDARLVAAGYDRTCAVTTAGSVTCWGHLAGATGSDGAAAASGPTRVEGVPDADEVAVGAFHACALTADGVRCWGSNASGQLGDGTNTDSAEPVAVA